MKMKMTRTMMMKRKVPILGAMMTGLKNVGVRGPAKMIRLKGLLMLKLDGLLKVTRSMVIHHQGKYFFRCVQKIVFKTEGIKCKSALKTTDFI